MGTAKPEIIFTFPAVMGGVSSFNFNLINHSKLIKNFRSKVILMREANDSRAPFTENFDADEQIFFEYSDKENQFHLQKRLNDLFGNGGGAIVTDNGLSMEAARRFNNPKTVFSLIHDYYYVNQQVRAGDLADVAIAHSSFFSDAVFCSDPLLFTGRSFYIPYGVRQVPQLPQKREGVLNVVFLGRLEDGKGAMRLFAIQQELKKIHVSVNWTIIGKGSRREDLHKQWQDEKVSFYEPETTEEVYRILAEQDVFIFPTIFEGTPVAILECLANGVPVIVNDLPGGIRDIVKEGIGYRCTVNDTAEYAGRIAALDKERNLLKQMQQNCFDLAHSSYDVEKNADKYFELFMQWQSLRRSSRSNARKLVKLDLPSVPNSITKFIRKVK